MRIRNLLPGKARVMLGAIENNAQIARLAVGASKRMNAVINHSEDQLRALLERAREDSAAQHFRHDPHERTAKICEIEHTTPDSITVHFTQDASNPIRFSPGQFLTVVVELGGVVYRRAYSFCSDPTDENRFAISVKRVRDGVVSNHLNDTLREGMSLRVSGPNGRFGTSASPGNARDVVLIAGGSGITPLLSIARSVARGEANSRVHLLYANQCAETVMHLDDIEELAAEHDNLTVHHVLEDPSAFEQCVGGRIDAALLSEFMDGLEQKDAAEYYVCGPTPMMDAVTDALRELGVGDDSIFVERFLDQSGSRSTDPADEIEYQVDYLLSEQSVKTLGGETVLSRGLSAGIDMDFSCTMGGCAACKVKLVSGEVTMDEPNCLTREERKEGYILACVARPRTDLEIER